LQGSRSVRQIAAELGVTDTMLYEWRRRFAPRPGADTGTPQTAAEKDEEIRRLRAEVVRLQEREIVLSLKPDIIRSRPRTRSFLPLSQRRCSDAAFLLRP
jgi:transposase-like protein